MTISRASRKWKVRVTRQADTDLHEIVAYIAEHDDPDTADALLDRLTEAKDSLATLPERGRIPPELKRLAVLSYRELQISPYRMIYEVDEQSGIVHVHLVIDGRRNVMRTMEERLLRTSNIFLYDSE